MSDDYKPEICARCGVLGADRRTLWMACFYAMNELGVPFEQVGFHGVVLKPKGHDPKFRFPIWEEPPYEWERKAHTNALFTLRVCKGCRSEWLKAIEAWFRGPPGPNVAWNDDASTYGMNDTLPAVLADCERLRAELTSLQQRADDLRSLALAERERREKEDSTKGTKP